MKSLFPLLLLLTLSLQGIRAQENPLDTLVKKFHHYRINALQEKTYAHLDRNLYLTGETLWFKIYTVDGSFHKPLLLSKVAYVEILDKENFPVLQAKIELKDGSGNGSLFLPSSLSSGTYKFRAYTNWMKNFGPEFYFHQTFTIINPFVTPEPTQSEKGPAYTADFFPEGGNLVAGIESKIGFKITNAFGQGVSCKGYLLNEYNDTLTSFTPAKFGIGHFRFTPSDDVAYQVRITDSQGNSSTHAFPDVYPSGYVMQLLDSGQFLRIKVTASAVASPFVYLFVHARQVIVSAEVQMLHGNQAVFSINKSVMPAGISHVTVFNDKLDPLCERLYFTYPDNILDIEIESNQKQFSPRRRVALSIQTKTGKTFGPADLSIAVFKADSLSTSSHIGIFHHLWLAADIGGVVESPEYYFTKGGPAVTEAMDNLMLTHGWRRFDWKNILKEEVVFRHLPEHNGHLITGIVSNREGIQSRVMTYLASPGKVIRVHGSRSNHLGEVRFAIKDFYGSRKLVIQAQGDADSTLHYQVQLQNPFSSAFDEKRLPPFAFAPEDKTEILSKSIAMQVQDIFYYEDYGKRFVDPDIDSSAFYGQPDATYYLDDYTRFPVMEEVMREYVPGVFVRKRKDGFHLMLVDLVNGGVLNDDPMILLDGVPVFDADEIMQFDPLRIKKLEVVKRQYYLGQAVFSGIVSYSTYQGDLGGFPLDPRSISLNYDGLQVQRRFHSPVYNNDQQRANRTPDQRYLLYWNPQLITDQQGKQLVEFYTSDVTGTYHVVVEGLNRQGISGSKLYTFTVKSQDHQ